MKKIVLPAFILLALVQWYVPVNMMLEKEQILKKGKEWRFLTQPVDPSDPFRGRSITLSFEEDHYTVPAKENFRLLHDVFVLLARDQDGFAKISGLSTKEPAGNVDYVKATMIDFTNTGDSNSIILAYPFNEYYMDEYKAPEAETVYRKSAIDSTQKTWALVKIWKGNAVIEDVLIDSVSIRTLSSGNHP